LGIRLVPDGCQCAMWVGNSLTERDLKSGSSRRVGNRVNR